MMSCRILSLWAALALVALVATVGIARTVGVQSASRGFGGEVTGVPSGQNASLRHRNLTCGTAIAASTCEKIETMLPIQ